MNLESFRSKEPLASATSIIDIQPQDSIMLSQASDIYDVSLGQKYIPPEDLLKYANNPSEYILIGSTIEDKLLGVMLAFPLDEKTARECNEAFKKHNIPFELPRLSVGVIKSVSVHPEYRHRGIGTRLTLEAMERLRKMSCGLFLAIAWDSGKVESSPKMFEKLGYKSLLDIPEYWYEDSIKEGYQCPNCGNPCHCKAIFYFK